MRYGLAFVATSFLARNFSPEVFGTYQLILNYLMVFEAFLLVNPTHLRNYLAENPNEEKVVISLWIWQNLAIFLVLLAFCLAGLSFSDEKVFWILLIITIFRLALRYNDYVWIICDQRLLNHLAQQVAIVQSVSINVFRIIFAVLKTNVYVLTLASPLQGICSAYQQKKIGEKIDIKPHYEFDAEKFTKIIREGFFLAVLSFISTFQSRIISLILAEHLQPQQFGNFQLVIKLMEPGTMLGVTIIGANYSVLANSLQANFNLFNQRFFKIGALTFLISILMTAVVVFIPSSLLVRFFGEQYSEGLSLLGLGSVIIVSNTLFWIDQYYDFLRKDYVFSLIKYIIMLLGYVLSTLYFSGRITIVEGLWISILVPFSLSFLSLSYRIYRSFMY